MFEVNERYSIQISGPKGIYYLIYSASSDRDKWFYFLSRACQELPTAQGTETEQLLSSIDFESSSVIIPPVPVSRVSSLYYFQLT